MARAPTAELTIQCDEPTHGQTRLRHAAMDIATQVLIVTSAADRALALNMVARTDSLWQDTGRSYRPP
jgi:hypothetical protein